jgi:hypothetical protein
MMGCILLDLGMNWRLAKDAKRQLAKIIFVLVLSFMVGLLPQVDNLCHIGGFLMGIISGLVLLPTINFGMLDRRIKKSLRYVFFPVMVLIFAGLSIAFVTGEAEERCPWCKYLDCIPQMFPCGDGY